MGDNRGRNMDGTARLDAINSVTGAFARFASAVIGFGALLYCVGYLVSSVYFSALDAPWVVDSLSTPQIMHRGASVALLFAFTFSGLLVLILRSRAIPHYLGVLAAAGYMVAFIAIGLATIPYLDGSRAERWALAVGAYLTPVCAALTAAELVAHLSLSPNDRRLGWMATMFGLLAISLVYIPFFAGRYAALRTMDSNLTRLPLVSIGEAAGRRWHLLISTGDKLVLIRANGQGSNQFKVVDATKAEEIEGALK